MIFGRNRHVKVETVTLPEGLQDDYEEEAPVENEAASAPEHGPYDISQRKGEKGYLDLGAMRIPVIKDVPIRLDVEESTKRVIGVTLTDQSSTLQVQIFAAPKRAGLWDEIRQEIIESVGKNEGAEVGEREGLFGTEVMARLPAQMPDGKAGWRVARFLGVDGPRWFLRGVLGGQAAFNAEAAQRLLGILANIIVDRGNSPLPPRELLPLRPPANIRPVKARTQNAAAEEKRPSRSVPERGPEITEIR